MNKNFWERLQSKTPVFFKGVIKIAGIVVATGAFMATDLPGIPHVHIPELFKTIGGYMIAVGSVAGFVAKLAVCDPNTPTR